MTRAEWLADLRVGSSVNLVTPCGVHTAVVERYENGRLWVMWALGYGGKFWHSSTWVHPETGENQAGLYRIEPAETELVKRESFND